MSLFFCCLNFICNFNKIVYNYINSKKLWFFILWRIENMLFRNSVSLLLTNFSNVWKILLYYLICTVLTVLICLPILHPVVSKLSEANVFENFWALANNIFYNPTNMAYTIDDVINTFISVVSSNSSQFLVNYILFGVVIVFVCPFMFGLASLAVGDVLYGFMTSQVRYSFTGSYIRNLGKSCLYCLTKILFILPLNLIIVAVAYGVIKIATLGSIGYVFLAILVFAFLLMLIALKVSLFNCWMPTMAVLNIGPFKALKTSFKTAFRKFGSIYSTAILFTMTSVVFSLCFGIFTFLLALVIIIPLIVLTFIVFQMVSYFTSQGMRFYVYPDMFISPKKFEERDTIKKIKFIV